MSEDHELEQLRRALATSYGEATAECPSPDRIWAAVHGELPPDELRAAADHAAACPACFPAWRLARELAAGEAAPAVAAAPPAPATVGWQRWAAGLAAAAALIASLWLLPTAPKTPTMRGGDHGIGSLVAADALPRDAFTLRWTPVAGARYEIEVSAGLSLVDRDEGLERPEHTVAPAHLADLPAGTAVRWQVWARTEDGHLTSSPVFITRLE